MIRLDRFWFAALLAAASVARPAAAQSDGKLPPMLRDVGIDQRLNDNVPLDLRFRDESGRSVSLGDYFDGKPVILVLAYYRCPMLCTEVLNGLTDGLGRLSFTAGDEFGVITVSFDPRETAQMAAAKKQATMERYGRRGATHGWHFLTGDMAAIEQLTQAVGFRYTYDPALDQYAHASGIMVLTPQGTIARYLFGVEFSRRDLRLALVEASANKIGSPLDQAILFCYEYNPVTGKYAAAALNLVRLGGAATVLALAAFLIRMRRSERAPTAKPLALNDV